jgi:type I restriction enzyme, R subunit
MSKDYSEDQLIEQPCMDIFQELAWETANVYEGETFGENGTLGRDSEADVILRTRFYKAIKELNPNLPEQAYDLAYEAINSDEASKKLVDINYEKYNFLKDGIPVNYKNAKGEIVRNKKIRVFDFEYPKNNNFIAVQQLWMEGKSKRKKRPDVVGFVNGLPLVFIELKGINVKLRAAYEKNLRDYKNTIPKIFHCNAFVILSNGVESKMGSITSKYEHFNDWKRISEEDEGIVSLDTIIKGTCEKSRLLDLFENFILFDTSIGSVAKLVARNHQYIGVNKAIEHFQVTRQKAKDGIISIEDAQKLGVFWHTQGSGKSYSMVFLCQKILRVLGGGYTFLLVTDRNELDKQIYGTFAGVGAVKDKTARATSGAHLKELLKTDKRFLFSIIHKFNFDEKITDRDNIIVISDEAHRTQGGSLAMNLRKALPNASFIGFTGTPLFKDDELTRRIFGDYVSKYDFKRSIEDGATVPLYYENRGEKLQLDNPQINQEIREAIEQQDLDSNQEDKLKKLFAREYPILTSEKRLRAIAKDVVEHFNARGYKGKAMFVAMDKVTAVRMYNYITEAWETYLEAQLKETNKITDEQEKLNKQREWEWSKETELGVVVSHEQNEIEKFEAWGLDIEPHRFKMNTADLEKDFKDEDHPFRFAIVCAMWITGFDVKSLSTMYIDKPLKSHTLMQTIARANRVHKDKNNGLIVDYIETYKALLEALAIYGSSDSKGGSEETIDSPVKPLEELVHELEEAVKVTEYFLKDKCKFSLSKIIEAQDNLHRIKYIQEGYNAICNTDETKAKFGVLARELFKKYKALMPDKSIYQFQAQRDAINALYTMINAKIEEADVTHIVKQVQDVVNKSIESLNLELEKIEGYGQKIDISSLDFKKIEEEFLKIKGNQNVAVQSLKDKVSKKLNRLLDQNPLRINFYERYQEIIHTYNMGKEYRSIKEIFDELVVLLGDLSEEAKRAEREDLEEDELTVFDMLTNDKKISDKERAEVKEAAKELLERLKKKEFRVQHWAEKIQTASAVRKVIEDYLFEKLPSPSYDDDISTKADILYNDFKERYADYGQRVA